MVSNNQRLEALELRPIPINGTQDEQSLTQEASMIGNELRYELLAANQEEQQQSVHTPRWYSSRYIPTSKRFYTILVLVLTVSTSAVVLVQHYTKHRGEQIAIKEYVKNIVENVGSPEDIGYFDVYIRESTYDDVQEVRFPAAVFKRSQFPLDGPFTSFKPEMPVFIHEATKQTAIFLSNGRVYLFPELYNTDEQVFSLGELINSGSATFDKSSFEMPADTNLVALFRSGTLVGSDMPTYDPRIGSFTDGILTNYRPPFVPKLAEISAYNKYPNYGQRNPYYGEYSEYKTRNPYYKKPKKSSTTTVSTSKKSKASTTPGTTTPPTTSIKLLPEPPSNFCNISFTESEFVYLYLYANASAFAAGNISLPPPSSADFNATILFRLGLDAFISAFFTYRNINCPTFCSLLLSTFGNIPLNLTGGTFIINNFVPTLVTNPRNCFNPFFYNVSASTNAGGLIDGLNTTGSVGAGAIVSFTSSPSFNYSLSIYELAIANVFADLGILSGTLGSSVTGNLGALLDLSIDIIISLTTTGGCNNPYLGYYCCCTPTFVEEETDK